MSGSKGRRYFRLSRSIAGLLGIGVLCAMGTRPPAQLDSDATVALARYRSDVVAYFKASYLLPIVVPEGQQVGDVYDPGYWILEDRAQRCFPSLPARETLPSVLPALTLSAKSDAGFALGLAKLLDLSASGSSEQKLTVSFSDVRVANTSKGELRQALSEQCSYLKAIMDEAVVPPEDMVAKVVVGKVVYARPMVFVGSETEAAAAAKVASVRSAIASIVPSAALLVRDLDANASANLGFGQRRGVLIEVAAALPVAFAPAFIPKPVFDQFRSTTANASTLKGYEWKEFDPDSVEQQELFGRLVDGSSK